jgi:hypothetical protein
MAALVLSAAGAAAGNAVFGPAGAIAGRLVGRSPAMPSIARCSLVGAKFHRKGRASQALR